MLLGLAEAQELGAERWGVLITLEESQGRGVTVLADLISYHKSDEGGGTLLL